MTISNATMIKNKSWLNHDPVFISKNNNSNANMSEVILTTISKVLEKNFQL
jgi:hypothetical protein